MKKNIGMNGFGRFGLHLLKYWLDRNRDSSFLIKYINDDFINIENAVRMINKDVAVNFNKYKIKAKGDYISILEPDGLLHEIKYSSNKEEEIPWIGQPDIFFECSGKNTLRNDSISFLEGSTTLVIISATSWDADDTLVFGYNHENFNRKHEIISYGSCTVNAFVPLASYMDKKYGLINSDVNVIHNIQEYRLDKNNTLNRKFCTLEKSAVKLLDSINKNNFLVNYTVIPYTGISMIDYRFNLRSCPSLDEIIEDISESIKTGYLEGLYELHDIDNGPEIHNCTTSSSVFIKENIKIVDNQIYLFSYFDNENSVNRYYDLANYISTER